MANLVTVTLNPALDVSTSVPRVEPTHKLRCTELRRDPGGGGINVARVVRRLGMDVLALYAVGGPIGQLLESLVVRERVESHPIAISAHTRENFTVDATEAKQQFRFVFPGPELSANEWHQCLEGVESLQPFPAYLIASGSLPPGVPSDFYARLARIARGHQARFVLDTSGPALKAALAESVYLIKPNLRELSELVGRPLTSETAQAEACRVLVERGQAEVVALTLGHQGALVATRQRMWRAAPLNITPVSAVGAGDSFLGGLLWSLACGHELPQALQYAMAAGSAAVLAHGTGLCEAHDVARLYPHVQVTRVT